MNSPVIQSILEYSFTDIFKLYPNAIKLKALSKTKSEDGEKLLKLDKWFQEDLPITIKKRKPPHINVNELVDIMKWKLLRGKWRPRLLQLAESNSPEKVIEISSKAFLSANKCQTTEAVKKLNELKGVGPATASAILTPSVPEHCAFFADEVAEAFLKGKIGYTLNEYIQINESILEIKNHLKKESKENWTSHEIELTIWTYTIIRNQDPSLLNIKNKDESDFPPSKRLKKGK